jgi:hypothetical protein
MPVKKVLKVLKNKVKTSAFKKTDAMDKALEEFDDYINLGIKPAPLQGPDLKPTLKQRIQVEKRRQDEEYYEAVTLKKVDKKAQYKMLLF